LSFFRFSTDGLLVPEDIVKPAVSVLALTWFIRYIYDPKNVMIFKTKVHIPQT